MEAKKFYVVYDKQGNIVCAGKCYIICKRLDIVKSTVTKAVKEHRLVRRKYYIYEEEVEDE